MHHYNSACNLETNFVTILCIIWNKSRKNMSLKYIISGILYAEVFVLTWMRTQFISFRIIVTHNFMGNGADSKQNLFFAFNFDVFQCALILLLQIGSIRTIFQSFVVSLIDCTRTWWWFKPIFILHRFRCK